MNNAPHLYFAWQQLVEKSQLMLMRRAINALYLVR